MRKIIHDSFSRVSLQIIDGETWSKNKSLMHPSRIDTNTNDFTIIGKTCLTRELLETEPRFFNNDGEVSFAEGGEDYDMSLSCREKFILLLDTRAC